MQWLLALFVLFLSIGSQVAVAANADVPVFKDEELDQMLAPIALYPDSLLSQVLMASTYPLDVKEAAAWSKANPDQKGDAAVKLVEGKEWEPSVMSLVAFPQVLAMMDARPADVQRLGDAFLADPGRVMDRVQFLRQKAQQAGNLKSSDQLKVSQQTTDTSKQVIVIEPAQPQTVYVPVYQPTVVYGSWWYPYYPPYYWAPPPYYYPGGAFMAGFMWGVAIGGINNCLWGGFHWGHSSVNINVNRYNSINVKSRHITQNNANFTHNPARRGDVPYRDNKSREAFGKKELAGAKDREAFRGKDNRDADRQRAANTLKERGADPAAGRERLQGADREKASQAVNRGASQPDRARDVSRETQRTRPTSSGGGNSALSGVRDGASSKANAARGQSSRGGMAGRERASHGGAAAAGARHR
jgi:hypothetical protein